MKELIIYLRCMQFFYQNCHNLVSGPTFFQDHCVFSEFYEKLTEDYDSCVERFIGLFGVDKIDLVEIQESAVEKLKSYPKSECSCEMFETGLKMEEYIIEYIEKLCKQSYSQGTLNALAAIADCSEVRVYKIKQRIQK
jgi:DNA-binding ferritin-like protein